MKRSSLLALLLSHSVWSLPGLAAAQTSPPAPPSQPTPPAEKPAPKDAQPKAAAPATATEASGPSGAAAAAPGGAAPAPGGVTPVASAAATPPETAPPTAPSGAPAVATEAQPSSATPAGEAGSAPPSPPTSPAASTVESPQGVTPTGRAAPPSTDLSALNEEETLPEEEPSKFLIGITWDFSLPLGNTADFTDAFGFQGFSLEVKYIALGRLGFGGMVSWHSLGERTFATLEDENATLTGTQVRELSFNPITLRAHYAFSDRPVKPKDAGGAAFKLEATPYVALGLGGARAASRVDLGIDVITRESWHFTMVPEVGLELPVGPVILIGSTRLNFLAGSGDRDEQLYVNFNLGAAFR